MATLAELAGIPLRTYVSIDSGETWPRQDNLEAIAKALGVSAARLFNDPTIMATPEEALRVVTAFVHDAQKRLSDLDRAVALPEPKKPVSMADRPVVAQSDLPPGITASWVRDLIKTVADSPGIIALINANIRGAKRTRGGSGGSNRGGKSEDLA